MARGRIGAAVRGGALAAAVAVAVASAGMAEPLWGFTAFPFDLTPESEDRVHAIIARHANLFAIHMDNCLPWVEAMAGEPFPDWFAADWARVRSHIPAGHKVYVAMTPTDNDRQSLAPQCGRSEDRPARHPRGIRGKPLDDPAVIAAYVAYLRRQIDFFRPAYVNIGIEMSEMSLRAPELWPAFETLYLAAVAALKDSHPQVQVGIELGLQSLTDPRVGAQVRRAVEASDFMCLSFYPYAAEAARVLFGAPPLPPPPEQWRVPLDWVRSYTDKPLAVCETGHPSRTVELAGLGVTLPGDPAEQALYLRDLVRVARRDGYLFVVWFIAVDYERLMAALPGAAEWMWIWAYTGLFGSDLAPRPALAEWPLPR
jgi:hypothetical protein